MEMNLEIKQNTFDGECNGRWYISDDNDDYLWRDLKIYSGTGFFKYGVNKAPGYYPSEKSAKYYLQIFKEKHNMADKIEINVKVNGKDVPLHEVSEQTLLTIRENSKPKPVPAFRVCKADGKWSRLIIKLPESINKYAGKFIMFDSEGFIINSGGAHCHDHYSNMRELKLEDL